MSLNIVLVEPEIPQNTGNIIRSCAATGTKLHLVRPLGFSMEDKYLKRAGLDYWDLVDIQYYDSFDEVREQNPDAKFFYSTTKAKQTHSDVEYEDNSFIVFGKETKGDSFFTKLTVNVFLVVDKLKLVNVFAKLYCSEK